MPLASSDLYGQTVKVFFLATECISLANASTGFGWFENRWISDADATVVANPLVEQLDKEEMQTYRNMFGHTVWDISDGMFTAIQHGVKLTTVAYTIRPIESDRFEIIIDDPYSQTILIISRTESGFCALSQPVWISEYAIWGKNEIVECYVPDNN